MHENSGITVLGIDGGLANMGWAVVRLDPVGETVLAMGVIRTEKANKKQRVLASDDVDRRAAEIAHELEALQVQYAIRAVCQESMSFPRSSSVAAKLGVARGVVAAHTARFGLPRVGESPQGIKKAVAGQKNASKEGMQWALERRYASRDQISTLDPHVRNLPISLHEHPYDALAAVVACLSSDVLITLRGEVQARQAASSRKDGATVCAPVNAVAVTRRVTTRGQLTNRALPNTQGAA